MGNYEPPGGQIDQIKQEIKRRKQVELTIKKDRILKAAKKCEKEK